MNLYDVLRRIIEARPFQDHERAEALRLIDEAERMRVFGTVGSELAEGHEHDWIRLSPAWRRCQICSLEEGIPR